MGLHLNFGPFHADLYSLDNWCALDLRYVTNNKKGDAMRSSVVRLSAKSEHIIEAMGRDDTNDTFVCPDTGRVFHGRIITVGKAIFSVPARKVWAKYVYNKKVDDITEEAAKAVDADLVDDQVASQNTAGGLDLGVA